MGACEIERLSTPPKGRAGRTHPREIPLAGPGAQAAHGPVTGLPSRVSGA